MRLFPKDDPALNQSTDLKKEDVSQDSESKAEAERNAQSLDEAGPKDADSMEESNTNTKAVIDEESKKKVEETVRQ